VVVPVDHQTEMPVQRQLLEEVEVTLLLLEPLGLLEPVAVAVAVPRTPAVAVTLEQTVVLG
jgi:hypothetical protein